MEVAPRLKLLVHCLDFLHFFQRSPVCTAYTVFIVYTAFIAKTLARKGRCQRRFSGFFPLRGGGYPPFPLRVFGHNDFPLRGGGGGAPPPFR